MKKHAVQIGDIFEIETKKGKAYLHFILIREDNMELVRVLDGLYTERPKNLDEIAGKKEAFYIQFSVKAAARKEIIKHVGHYPADKFPEPGYMRSPFNVRGKFLGWHIVNTKTLKRELVKELSDEQKKLSSWGWWNDTYLRERLEEGWTLEKWI